MNKQINNKELKEHNAFTIKKEEENSKLFYSTTITENIKQERKTIINSACFLITVSDLTARSKETLYINANKQKVSKVKSKNATGSYKNNDFKIIIAVPHFNKYINLTGKSFYEVKKKNIKYFLTKEEFDIKYQEAMKIKDSLLIKEQKIEKINAHIVNEYDSKEYANDLWQILDQDLTLEDLEDRDIFNAIDEREDFSLGALDFLINDNYVENIDDETRYWLQPGLRDKAIILSNKMDIQTIIL